MERILPKLLLTFLLSRVLGMAIITSASNRLSEEMDAFVEQEMNRHNLPGLALAVTQGDQVIHLKGYGEARDQAPVTPQTQFYLASVSKSFTAAAVMQLVEAGKIDLDAPVQQYLPEFTTRNPGTAARVTVRHLLNQTSGLADRGFQEIRLPQMKTPAERLTSLRSAQPLAAPGQEYHYFNPNYEVLARLVEVISGQPFSTYLQDHIFQPLGMRDTFNVIHSSETKSKAVSLAQGHISAYGIPLPVDEMNGYIGGSGGVISTAEDMATFLIMQNGQARSGSASILSPESIALMHTPPPGVATNYGMGWIAQQINRQRVLEHNGIFSAFYAEVALLPGEEIGIALLYNASSFPATAFAFPQIKNGLIALLTGQPPRMGGFTVIHWGLLFGLLTLVGLGQALRSLHRLPQWSRRTESTATWRLVPGILWAFTPLLFLLGMPSLVAASSGRFFGYAALLRSMPDLFVWLGLTAVLGLVNGALRLRWISGRIFSPKNRR